jgi:hypothetical protein
MADGVDLAFVLALGVLGSETKTRTDHGNKRGSESG